MRTVVLGMALVGCGGEGKDGTDGEEEPFEAWACVHIAEGIVLDGSATRDEAPTLTPGRTPYRVNLLPSVANYVRFEVDEPVEWTLITDEVDAVPAVWEGETRTELTGGAPNPECDEDLPEVQQVSLGAGEHWLELGPLFQGNVWLVLGE